MGNDANWVGFILEGTISNRDAVGSLVWLYTGEEVQIRHIRAGTDWIEQDNIWVHFGLGYESQIDSVVIRWPLGHRQVLTDVAINQYHKVKEPDYSAVENKEVNVTSPSSYRLEQNHPNPFNPSTTIQYTIKEAVHVKLTVYNIIGQTMATLVDRKQASGHYEVQWNVLDELGEKISNGMYFYRLEAEDRFIQTKKMILTE